MVILPHKQAPPLAGALHVLPSCLMNSSVLRARTNTTNLPKNLQAHFPPQQFSCVTPRLGPDLTVGLPPLCVLPRESNFIFIFFELIFFLTSALSLSRAASESINISAAWGDRKNQLLCPGFELTPALRDYASPRKSPLQIWRTFKIFTQGYIPFLRLYCIRYMHVYIPMCHR